MRNIDRKRTGTSHFLRWVARGAAVIALTAGNLTVLPSVHATPNTLDAFYIPPPGFEEAAPGTILRSRSIDASYFQALPMPVDAWQLLYRTTAEDGRPYSAVTTVLESRGTDAPTTVLSFQSMTDSVAPQCMPSQVLRQGQVPWIDLAHSGPIDLSTPANETPLLAAALARGWAVSVPDYGGIDNHFLTPREPGFAVLDGIRATRDFAPARLPGSSARAMLWGYSGGGIASAWAAQEQPTYAPDVELAGAAIGAPVGDFRAAILSADGTPVGGALIPVALMGLVQGSPAFAAALDPYLTDAGRQKVTAAMNNCTPQNLLDNIGFRAGPFLTAPLADVLADPAVDAVITASRLGAATPATPLYIYNSIGDEISTIGAVDALASAYCDQGTPVTYRREQAPLPISAHTLEWALGAPAALAWLQQADIGATAPGCDTRSLPATIISPDALASLSQGIISGSVRALLGI